MLIHTIPILLFLFQAATQGVYAKCCRPDSGGDCGDNSAATPCCGYKPCNAFCCDCPGVQIIREVIETGKLKWTSVITAPAGETWTCRASHVTTWYPAPTESSRKRRREEPTKTIQPDEVNLVAAITETPHATFTNSIPPPPYSPQMSADLQDTFAHVCGGRRNNGVAVIDLEDYFGYFNVTADRRDTLYAKNVELKFHAHDINGDGFLTLDEAELRCDGDGCA